VRNAFISTLAELAADDERIVLLTGDLGFGVVEAFAERYPDRFYNIGVAEQNMVGVATGLAQAGLLPFVYSIVTFAVLRPYEFIRNGPAHHRFPVRIVGVGGGVEYGINGPTHHGLEDVALMRTLPQMTLVAPVDRRQAAAALRATATLPGPVYYRLGKDERTEILDFDGTFGLGRLDVARRGEDVAILALGPVAGEAVRAADALEQVGVSAFVAAVASVNPAPEAALRQLAATFSLIVTVEAHRPVGGLGSLVAEIAAGQAGGARVVRVGIGETGEGIAGGERYLLDLHGLSAGKIAARVATELARDVRLPAGSPHG
jgi:transketolase